MWVKQCPKPPPNYHHFYVVFLQFPNGWFMTLFYPYYVGLELMNQNLGDPKRIVEKNEKMVVHGVKTSCSLIWQVLACQVQQSTAIKTGHDN